MSTLFVPPYFQAIDGNGNPISGGTVTFYEPGTSTKKDVYTSSSLSTPASNPATLDSAGKVTVWLNGDYKARVEHADGSLFEETDNINPPLTTETTGGNLVANGSFETQGNASTDADGWTLTAQSDGTVERITTDNYDGDSALKFTSLGNGGGQADTDSFFAVSPGRQYEVSFALKCSVADIRNIVQVRYFDEDQSFLSNSSVYDEDTSNPTSWTLKNFVDTPPANARFAKLRILGADQSDATSGEAKFDNVVFGRTDTRFPNVNADVTATDEDLEKTKKALISGAYDGVVDATNGGNNDLTEVDFTGVSSDAKRITVFFDSISLDNTGENIIVQIGDSGGIEATGYDSSGVEVSGSAQASSNESTGFVIEGTTNTLEVSGEMVLTLMDEANNKWTETHILRTNSQIIRTGAGIKSLSGTLDRVRVTNTGTLNFDNGNLNVLVEEF